MSGTVLVLDASIAVRIAQGHLALRPVIAGAERVLAPAVFPLEVSNALWKYVRAGQLRPEAAMRKLHAAITLCDTIEPPGEQGAAGALSLAIVHDHPVYDMAYIHLAEREQATLATADRRLAALAQTHGLDVVVDD